MSAKSDTTKRRVTFEVDTSRLFDALQKMGGDTEALGARIVSTLLAPCSLAETLGMACYGVVEVGSAENAD